MSSSSISDQPQSVDNNNSDLLVRLCLGGEIAQVPASLVTSEQVFRATINKNAFDSLSVDAKNYLRRFLPKSDGTDADEDNILDCAFTNDPNFYFGNPIRKVHSKIRAGWFNPERPSEQVQLRDNARVLYDHYIRYYYISVLKKLLISRQQLLQIASKSTADEPILLDRSPNLRRLKRHSVSVKLQQRAAKRARFIISECKQQVGEYGLSSDDEPDPHASRTPVTAAGQGTLLASHTTDIQMHQPMYLEQVKDLIREYRILHEVEPDSPSLDFSVVRLEDVYERAGLPFIGDRQGGGASSKSKPIRLPHTFAPNNDHNN